MIKTDTRVADEELYSNYTRTSFFQDGYDKSSLKIMRIYASAYFDINFSRHIKAPLDASIIEVGSGNVRYLARIKELGYTNLVGIDLSEDQVAFARNELELDCVFQAEANEWMKSKNECYDVIFCLDVMEHLELSDLIKLTKSFSCALKPGGKIIVQVPNSLSPFSPVFHGDLTHKRAFTQSSLRQLFLHHGFSDVTVYESKIINGSWTTKARQLLYSIFLRPCFYVCSLIIHGREEAGYYTQNLVVTISK
jgi:2-polyprenyl-3-methyl-5-hydroxy-6-metoxy-1,4-benzoquinol methylase